MPVDSMVYGYIVNEQDYPDQASIIEEKTKGDWMYVILEGQAKVKKSTPKGKMTIDTLREGDVFGEMAMFEKRTGPRSASIIADGPVKVGVLDKDRLDREFEALSSQLKDLIRNLVKRLKRTTDQASSIAAE